MEKTGDDRLTDTVRQTIITSLKTVSGRKLERCPMHILVRRFEPAFFLERIFTTIS